MHGNAKVVRRLSLIIGKACVLRDEAEDVL